MAKNRLTKSELQEKREYAKLLFTKEKLTQKEIALRVQISQNTISKWATEDNWEAAQKSLMLTREEQLRQMMDELDILNNEIANGGRKYATKEQAYIRDTLVQNINKLELEVSAYEVYNVAKKMIGHFRTIDLDKAKLLAEDFDGFIKTLLR
ncbi:MULTISPECIES: terminase gpP N-terminus-related DNA-binding protein [Sphingobacterium]|uniref:terminase gpP N-terminus-related DNA-binding protein n=1 Tax=Sphingobacterium TaxID=28453 RepID=UPI00257DF012|nr:MULTISPECIES: hypothetical protein [Sphingobacterium]